MNVLFLTLANIDDVCVHGAYTDLLQVFMRHGYHAYIVSSVERRYGEEIRLIQGDGYTILRVKTGNIQKTHLIEKGVSTILLEGQFISAIKQHLPDVEFDLVLYSTPPVTLAKVIQFVKKRDTAQMYLLLKDIFPQNLSKNKKCKQIA